jgi:anti-sigma factor RsiW
MQRLTCRDFVTFLGDYLDGRLSGEQVSRFNEHLSRCPPCVTYTETYLTAVRIGKSVLRDSDESVPADVPEDLVQAILAARR